MSPTHLNWRQADAWRAERLERTGVELAQEAIGVFDSGVGGLSVLRHIHAQLPRENILYFADAGYAPYGDKQEAELVARSFAIAQFLLAQGAKALVVACNTATVASIKMLREHYSDLPLVGVEPGLKPAAAVSITRKVGVLATERTLSGEKFSQLQQQVAEASNVQFVLRAASGLADLIDKGELTSARTQHLLETCLDDLLQQEVDTIVLGCTHYPFVQPLIVKILQQKQAQHVQLIDTGEAVARQLHRVLKEQQLLTSNEEVTGLFHKARFFTSGDANSMQSALLSLLQHEASVEHVHVPSVKMITEI